MSTEGIITISIWALVVVLNALEKVLEGLNLTRESEATLMVEPKLLLSFL